MHDDDDETPLCIVRNNWNGNYNREQEGKMILNKKTTTPDRECV